MKKIILACHILGDGIGDFQHVLDLYQFITNNPELYEYELILAITCVWESILPKLITKLGSIGILNAYVSTKDKFHIEFLHNQTFLNHLAEANQLITVSSDYNFLDNPSSPFRPFINPLVEKKYIGEHERDSCFSRIPSFSMGLSETTYGIKLQIINKISAKEAYCIFEENDPLFSQHLLTYTNATNQDDLCEKTQIIPAYFNKFLPLYRMILLLIINESLVEGKDVAVVLSGSAGFDFSHQGVIFDEKFTQNSNVKEVRMWTKYSERDAIFVVNPEGIRTIHLFDDYQLSDRSYKALYQQACFAGVSGDNSLEQAISTEALPFYHSTNAPTKKRTLESLVKMIRDEIEIPEDVKQGYLILYENLPAWCETIWYYPSEKKELTELVQKFQALNMPKMISYWPCIVAYLRRHHNFYDKIESIILRKPLLIKEGHPFPMDAASSTETVCSYNHPALLTQSMFSLKPDKILTRPEPGMVYQAGSF